METKFYLNKDWEQIEDKKIECINKDSTGSCSILYDKESIRIRRFCHGIYDLQQIDMSLEELKLIYEIITKQGE